jgi:hypothetical protein
MSRGYRSANYAVPHWGMQKYGKIWERNGHIGITMTMRKKGVSMMNNLFIMLPS